MEYWKKLWEKEFSSVIIPKDYQEAYIEAKKGPGKIDQRWVCRYGYEKLLENDGLRYNLATASIYGHIHIVKILIDKCPPHKQYKKHSAVEESALHGHFEILKLLLNSIPNNSLYINSGFVKAVEGNKPTIVNYLLEKGANEYNGALILAARNGNLPAVKQMISLGATDYLSAAQQAVSYFNVLEYLVENYSFDLDQVFHRAVSYEQYQNAEYLLSKGAKPLRETSAWAFDDFLSDILSEEKTKLR